MGDAAPVAPAGPEGRLLAQQVGVHVRLHGQPLGGTAGQGVGHPSGQVEPGPVGEGDHVDLADADAREAQAEPDRLVGEPLGVPLAVEPLLLGQGHQPPVLQQAGGGVVAEAVDPKDAHPTTPLLPRPPGSSAGAPTCQRRPVTVPCRPLEPLSRRSARRRPAASGTAPSPACPARSRGGARAGCPREPDLSNPLPPAAPGLAGSPWHADLRPPECDRYGQVQAAVACSYLRAPSWRLAIGHLRQTTTALWVVAWLSAWVADHTRTGDGVV